MRHQIIIANVDNESMLGEIDAVPSNVFESTAIISNRLLWLARAGDIVILPRSPSAGFLKYIETINGTDFSNVTIIVPEIIAQKRASVTGEVLLSEKNLTSIKNVMSVFPNITWEILPYYFTTAIGRFGREIAKSFQLTQHSFNFEGGAEILNQKTIFRKFAAGINIPFATGEIVDGVCGLKRAVTNLLSITGTVIVKQDRSGGGEGNYAITSTGNCYFRGVSKVFSIATIPLDDAVSSVVAELATKGNESLTVEVYYETSQVVYSEYFVNNNGTVDYLNHGVMRMLPLWSGFEVPGQIQPKAQAELINGSTKLAMLAQHLGYVGHINMDAIITTKGNIIFTEINGRTGGCTHVHALSERLLGSNYLNTHHVTTYNKSLVNSLEDYLDLLIENQIYFDKEQGKGVVVLSSDAHEYGTVLELMFIAEVLDEALKIESIARMLADSVRNK